MSLALDTRTHLFTGSAGRIALGSLFTVITGAFCAALIVISASRDTLTSSAVLILLLGCAAVLPVLTYMPGLLEPMLLLLLSATLTISLKKHILFRADSMSGAVGYRISITDITLCALAVLVWWRHWRQTKTRPVFNKPLTIAFFVYLALAAASAFLGSDLELGLFELSALLQSFLLFVCLSNYLNTPRRIRIFVSGLLIGLFMQSAAAIVQAERPGLVNFSALGIEETEETVQGGNVNLPTMDRGTTTINGEVVQRPTGLMMHPNVLGLYLALLLPMAGVLALTPQGLFLRSLAGIGLLAGLPALYFSLSRSGWAAGVVAVALMALVWRRWRLPKLDLLRKLTVAGGVLVMACAIAINAPKIYDRLTENASESVEFRANLARASLAMIGEHPFFGVGLNTFLETVGSYDTSGMTRVKAYPVHNVYLLEWAENGIAGGTAFVILVGVMLWQMLAASRRAASASYRALAVALVCGLAGFFFAEMSGFVYRIPIMTSFVWSCVALVLALGSVAHREHV